MQIFYTQNIQQEKLLLDKTEARHCFKVLRHRNGDTVYVTDGKGHLFTCSVNSPSEALTVIKTTSCPQPRSYYLHLAVPALKNPDRIEWMVEKAVEIGIDEISFLQTHRTEKNKINLERIKAIAVSAMKQSLHYTLPLINPIVSFHTFIQAQYSGLKLIAHCMNEDKKPLKQYEQATRYTVMIGPEGDFTPNELREALSANFLPLSLGSSRLRSETAALAVCMGIYLINDV